MMAIDNAVKYREWSVTSVTSVLCVVVLVAVCGCMCTPVSRMMVMLTEVSARCKFAQHVLCTVMVSVRDDGTDGGPSYAAACMHV